MKALLRPALFGALQVGGVFAAGSAGYGLASAFHLPLPGNVLAIVVLYTLLATKLVRLEWLERGATLITTNLVLFIVPLIAVLLASLACGIVVTGRIAQGGESATKAGERGTKA